MNLAIEETLQGIGKGVFQQVGNKLYKKHRCYFVDCLEHPEYLSDILQEMFGKASESIIESIRNKLVEFSGNKPISQFLVHLGN